jgi:hypothetical protein
LLPLDAANLGLQLSQGKRLGNKIAGAGFNNGFVGIFRGITGHDNERDMRIIPVGLSHQFYSVLASHFDVTDHQIDVPLTEEGQGFRGIGRPLAGMLGHFKKVLDNSAISFIIIHDQDHRQGLI